MKILKEYYLILNVYIINILNKLLDKFIHMY